MPPSNPEDPATSPDDPTSAYLITTLTSAADAARAVIMPHFRARGSVENKASGDTAYDPVTEADKAAEQSIRTVIRERHPQDTILGEEFDDETGSGPFTWVIDPIDGTRAFIAGAPTWGTLIGAGTTERPVFGLMDQGFTTERHLGLPGLTLRLQTNRNEGAALEALQVAGTTELKNAILSATAPEMFGTGADWDAFQRVAKRARLTRYGLDCTAYGLLAAGHIDLVVEAGMKLFDIYALVPIVRGAGGVISDWSGGDDWASGRFIAAATPALHAEVLDVLRG